MSRRASILALAACALALAFGLPAGARAEGGNTAIAINTKDGTSVFKLAFAIRRVGGDVVDQTNAAVAFASCTDCQTVAIAIEVVLVTGDPSVVTPTNLALALNEGCDLCVTVANAIQWVLGTGGQVHFTAEGNQALARIRQELQELRKGTLSAAEVQQRLQEILDELRQVLENELVPAGRPAEAGDDRASTSTGEASTEPASTAPVEPPSSTTAPAATTTAPEATTTAPEATTAPETETTGDTATTTTPPATTQTQTEAETEPAVTTAP